MSELATRREQAIELIAKIMTFTCITESISLIEQALLAERRLAMAEALEIALDETVTYRGRTELQLSAFTVRSNIAAKLRAAAEKEVTK